MRVATKLSLALGSLIAIFILLLVFHVRSLRTVVATEYALSDISTRLVRNTSTQAARLDRLEESASKYAVTRDADYLESFTSVRDEFAADLDGFLALPLSEEERSQGETLARLWQEFDVEVASFADEARPAATFNGALLTQLRVSLDTLRVQVRRVAGATRATMEANLVSSAAIARRAEWLSWGAAALGLVLSIVLSTLIVRSISRSLRRLGQGTRQIAAGNFAFRLPSDQNDEFADLAHDFNLMNRRLGELDLMKRDFVSNVSHDLKTPLASMQEISRVLLDEVPGPLTDHQTQLLRLHYESGQRLASMIANLLDLSAVEAGAMKLRIASHELGDVLRTALGSVEAARANHEVDLAVHLGDDEITLDCDEQRLLQVLVNLLENAIKFSPPQGRVEVGAAVLRERPAWILGRRWSSAVSGATSEATLISVSDSGCGIPVDERPRVFERFFQSENGRREGRRGVGLGLAISREIVEAHGGSIWVDENEGGGCVFFVLLPRAAKQWSASTPASPAQLTGKSS